MPTNNKINQSLGYVPKKIAIFRALNLGDLLCSVPAVRALKNTYPGAEITLIGLLWAKQFTEQFGKYFGRLIAFPGYPGLPEQSFNYSEFVNFLHKVRKEQFDIIIQMHDNGSIVNSLLGLFNSQRVAGYYRQDSHRPNKELFMIYPDKEPEIKRHLKLMEFLGIPTQKEQLEFPLTEKDENQLARLQNKLNLRKKSYVCVHPGTSAAAKRWPPASFARIADRAAGNGLKVILTGVYQELMLTQAVAHHMKYPAINLTGQTSLGILGGLIRDSRLLIANDTGVSHIAAAFNTPNLIVSQNSPKNPALEDEDNGLKQVIVKLKNQFQFPY